MQQQADAQFLFTVHCRKTHRRGSSTKKEKLLERRCSVGLASEVEIFHHLTGETVTSIITEKTATAREQHTQQTHTSQTHTHRHCDSAGGKGADCPTAAATTEIFGM